MANVAGCLSRNFRRFLQQGTSTSRTLNSLQSRKVNILLEKRRSGMLSAVQVV